MPTKQSRGEERPWEQQRTTQALHPRRLRSEPVHSRGKRCRSVNARLRWWQEGVRALVMHRCCALHNVRVRLSPWQPMIESG